MDTSVIDLPAPVAARLRRPGWRDPRLLAGIAMVAASVLLGLVGGADGAGDGPRVRDACRAGAGGPRRRRADLAVVDVRLGTVNLDHYLRADRAGRHRRCRRPCRRSRRAGPGVGGRGRAADLDLRPVSVTLTRAPSSDVTAGRARRPVVHAAPPRRRTPSRPSRDELAGGLVVAEVTTPDGRLRASGGGTRCRCSSPAPAPRRSSRRSPRTARVDVVPVLGTGG